MKTNEREHGHEGADEESRVHRMLCAYVLGEADEDERGEIERLLKTSPELRAERERLESTIGLVRTTLGGADELPPESAGALTEALAAKQRRRWYRSPIARLAAAAGVLGLAFAGWRATAPEVYEGFTHSLFGEDTAVARAEKDQQRNEPLPSSLEGQLKGLGYLGDDGSASVVVSEAEPAAEQGRLDRAESVVSAGISAPASTPPAAPAAAGEVLGEAFEVSGAAGREVAPRFGGKAVADAPAEGKNEAAREVRAALRELGYAANEPRASDTVPAPVRARAKLASPAAGPASPGAPATVGVIVTGSEDFYLGRGGRTAGEVTGETIERLRKLGYTEADFEAGDDDRVLHDSFQPLGLDRDALLLRRRIEFVLGSCQRRPSEHPRDMYFRFWGDNPFEWTALDRLSTFSVDVDTASYALARRYLAENRLPTKAQVRTEEFVNYFDADVPAPLESTFAIHTELAPSRFGAPDAWMLRVAVRGKDVTREERQPLTLTFVVDVSGSMKQGNRLELVKHALRLLVGELDARDSISLVAFSKEARLILPMTSAGNRSLIETALFQLQPDGGTNAEAGLLLGYEQALAALTENSHNRVVLLSDGVANIGNTDQQTLTANVERHRRAGIYLNTVGVGMGNHNDVLLEQLADKGDGVCNYVDDAAEARRVLVERFTGAFEPIARDVKIQVEFDPGQVERYRLLGYENRAIADADFRNDAVDAGEVNAGHQVVALYELVGAPGRGEDPLATVRLRWKPPHPRGVADAEAEVATEVEHPVRFDGAAPGFRAASPGYRRSVLVAQFAEFLRRSSHAREDSLDQLIEEAKALEPQLGDDEFTEFVRLAERSRQLVLAELARYDELERALDAIRHCAYLQAQIEDLNERLGRDRLHELDAAAKRLAERIAWMRALTGEGSAAVPRGELEALERENARLREQVRRLLEIVLDPERRVR